MPLWWNDAMKNKKSEIVKYLCGRNAKTIKEVARAMKLGYYTTSRYLAELYDSGEVKLNQLRTKPYKYFVSIRKDT